MELSFIIIDDTELDQFIARKVISNANHSFSIKSFLDGSQAMDYILADNHDDGIKIIPYFFRYLYAVDEQVSVC